MNVINLVEKAYAKLKGSYSSISGGFFGEAMFTLNGNCYWKLMNFEDVRAKAMNKIMKYVKCGFPKYSEKDECANHDLIECHSYLILNVLEIDGNRFFFLRNPWGEKVWNGDYSKGSPLLTPSLCGKLKEKIADDTFYMIEKDFLKYFTRIGVVKSIDLKNLCRCCECRIHPLYNMTPNLSDLELQLDKNPNFRIRMTDQIENGKSAKFRILFEKQIELNEPRYYKNTSVVFFAHKNVPIIEYSNSFVFSTSSTFEKMNDSVSFAICNYGMYQSEQVYYIKVFCEQNFELYNFDEKNFKLYSNSLHEAITKILDDS